MKIVENGKAFCSIHIPENFYTVELFAAKQLAKYLKKVSGADFRILKGIPESTPAIVLAEKNHLEEKRVMADESVMRFVDGQKLFLVGADTRAVLLCVYDFLHRDIGCIFAQTKIEYIPEKKTIEIKDDYFYYHQPFMNSRYILSHGDIYFIDWCAKVMMSHSVVPSEIKTPEFQREREIISSDAAEIMLKESIEKRGEKGLSIGLHVFETIMPPSKYFEQHPEYFAFDPDQKPDALHRIKNGRNSYGICWTHPEVKKIFIDYLLDFFKKYPYIKRLTFFPNDGQGPCFCDNCRKIEEPWTGRTTKQLQYTKNYVLFSADIAGAIAKHFPDVRLEIGSYDGHTELPDDFDQILPENIDVIFCIYERKWDRALDNPPSDEELRRTLAQTTISSYEKDAIKYTIYPEIFQKWKKHIKGNMRYYDYLTSTLGSMGMLFPVSRETIRTIKFLKKSGFYGYGSQWFNSKTIWTSYGLSLYVTSWAAWDENVKWEDAAFEYCLALYQKAAQPMFDYYKTLEDSAINVRFGMGIPEILQIFDRKTYSICREKLEKAFRIADSNTVKKRIRDQKVLLEFGYLFWQTREIEKKIEEALSRDNLDECFLLLAEHARIDHRIQKLFNYPLLSNYKKWRGILYRHILGSQTDKRGLIHVINLLKNATNAKFENLWYKD